MDFNKPAAAGRSYDGFRVVEPVSDDGGSLSFTVEAGNLYISGLQFVLQERRITWSPRELQPADGSHLVYLEVWQRSVTHLEDEELREVALGVDDSGRPAHGSEIAHRIGVLPNIGTVDCDQVMQILSNAISSQPAPARLETIHRLRHYIPLSIIVCAHGACRAWDCRSMLRRGD